MLIQSKFKFFSLFLLVVLNSSKAGGEILLVGDGELGTCGFIDIQNAIDAANPGDEIRVTRATDGIARTYFENLSIDKDLILKGGYTNCSLAELDSRLDENLTIINGSEFGNVIKVEGDELTVAISGFTLTNGVDEGFGPTRAQGGGVSILGDDNEIIFEHMTFTDNHGRLGGGIYIDGGSNNIFTLHTLIIGNTASSGGGIYCGSNNINNYIQDIDLEILGNQANGDSDVSGHGGGIYLSKCNFVNALPIIEENESLFSIRGNHANNSGGGIYVVDGIVELFGTLNANVANVDSNTLGNGGGLFSQDSDIRFAYSDLVDNLVNGGSGGGIYAESSVFSVDDFKYTNCMQANTFNCMRFRGNHAIPLPGPLATIGGALYLVDTQLEESNVNVNYLDHFPGIFEGNYADNGTVLSMHQGSTMSIQNAYFIANNSGEPTHISDDSLVYITGAGTHLKVSHSTLADNQVNSVFNLQPDTSLDLINSIIYEESEAIPVMVNNLASVSTNCNLYHEGESVVIPFGENSLVTDDPGFIGDDDYHLRENSVAIDRCLNEGLKIIYPDRDLDERPIDIPGVSNGIVGHYDAGADEYSDAIFAHGFEEV
ncbi:MAG: hypothetical protein ACSHWU_06320 [Marinicella sp.]